MKRLRLQWKIFAFLLGFCALLLAVLWLFQTAFLSEMYQHIRRSEIEKAIESVENDTNNLELEKILKELEEDKEIYVSVSDGSRKSQRPDEDNRGKEKNERLSKDKTITLEDGRTLILTFDAAISPVNATISTLRIQLVIITGIMILLSSALALLIARNVSKPIVEINESAKVLASGRYDTSFEGHGFLEIEELSDTLNTAAAELSKVENLRRELMANVSHDLRTPLALIYSYAEMMHDFPDEIKPEQTQIIMGETKRLTSLVNDIMIASKLEAGIDVLDKQRYNLTKSIEITMNRMAELVRRDGYYLTFEHGSDIYITADEIKITQAFYNLLINAVNHSLDDKRIKVRQEIQNGYVTIEVINFGKDIEIESLPYIWERYYKVDKEHRRAVTGSGLGLSIVKKIIEQHDGKCGVESGTGKGNVFSFSLKISI